MRHLQLFENFDKSDMYYHGTKSKFTNFKLDSKISSPTYGGVVDNGLGIFFTDNLTMAKWFAGLTEYDSDVDEYVDVKGPGRVISVKLNIKNPWILNDEVTVQDEDDPGQDYFRIVEENGGGQKFREKLMNEGYDSVIVKDVTTNYYADGTYDIVVVLDPEHIKIISNNGGI